MSLENQKKVWDDIYQAGHEQKAPWDTVVSFVYSCKPTEVINEDVRILEVGCGTAGNLRFFAQQGFQVSGIDFSVDAINCARSFFEENNLDGELKEGSFESLDFDDNFFDLVVDRAALTCVGTDTQVKAISEINRVLKPHGAFLYTPYADTHSSALSATKSEDGLSVNIKNGLLQGVGGIRFVSRQDIEDLFSSKEWTIISMEYETREDILQQDDDSMHSSWRVIVQKN